MSLKDKTPAETLDERGNICPYPLMNTTQKLKEMIEGELLEVLVDHPPSVENIIHLSNKLGLEHEVDEVKKGEEWRVYVQK